GPESRPHEEANAMQSRRTVLKTVAGASLMSAASLGRVLGANDRVRVGFIGHGLIGTRHLLDFKAQPDVEIVAVSELSEERMEAAATAAGTSPARYKDFRKLLDRPDVDAVVVSTPDHWHALMTILACAAGKDVYVEKPLTLVLREGEWMQQAADAHKRVVQVGTQQRSGKHYRRCAELVRDGQIGDVRSVRMASYRNILPGFTKPVGDRLSPADWDMWLGPAPFVAYDPGRCLYHFRWFWDYSGGQTTNLLAHHIDTVQWMMGLAPPLRVAAMGGRYSLKGIGETPDVFEALFEYPGLVATWSSHEIAAAGDDGLAFYGTKGTLKLSRAGFEIVPELEVPPEEQIPRFSGPRTAPVTPAPRTTPLQESGYEQVRDQFVPHVRDFLDCVKSRKTPISDLASSHRASVPCHLANLALRLGRTLHWDAAKQDLVADPEASKLLTKEYRGPWDRELKAALARG
ncbi:MAG: Gfo/Idh/MocA family protein, partial [Burkholderiales bacterium]